MSHTSTKPCPWDIRLTLHRPSLSHQALTRNRLSRTCFQINLIYSNSTPASPCRGSRSATHLLFRRIGPMARSLVHRLSQCYLRLWEGWPRRRHRDIWTGMMETIWMEET